MDGEHENNNNNQAGGDQQIDKPTGASPIKNNKSISQPEEEQPPCTPEKVQKIPRDDSFKTCKATMPTPATRRQLRATPARNSILSGGKPYKEVTTSGRKFNSRRKPATNSKRNPAANCTSDRLNESADSNETFIRHERELAYDPDSLDLDASTRRQPLDLDDGINRPDITNLTSSSSSPNKQLSPIMKPNQKQQEEPKSQPTPQRSARRMSKMQMQKPKPIAMPTSTPMPFAIPKAKSKPKPNQFYFNRYMSSTAKKPQQQNQQLKQQQQLQQQSSIFKKPSSVISNFSVASSRRCLSQWNTPRLTRAQSFKSTAELEREYFSSLRSRF